jgi:hypothetical protein
MISKILKWFKPHKKKRETKLEYWSKWELYDLIEDIEKSYGLLAERTHEGNNPHLAYFKESLEIDLFDLNHDNVPDFSNVWHWFRPDGEWRQLTKKSSEEIRESIYYRANRWKTEASKE